MKIFYQDKAFHARKKSEKMTLPPLKNIPLTLLHTHYIAYTRKRKQLLECHKLDYLTTIMYAKITMCKVLVSHDSQIYITKNNMTLML